MEDKPPQQCVIPIHKPSRKEYIFFFISGIALSFPFAYLSEQFTTFFPTPLQLAVLTLLLAPFLEELAKVFSLFYRHGETERSLVALGVIIGLGFGISELIVYVVFGGVPLIVRIPGVIFHASSAAITAYGIAKKNPLPYYLLAVFLHFANNFFALEPIGGVSVLFALLVLIVAYLLAWHYYHQASKTKMVV